MPTCTLDAGVAHLFTLLEPLELTTQTRPEPLENEHTTPGQMSSSFRHNGWKGNRAKVFAALQRTAQPHSRVVAFRTCGSHAYVIRSLIDREKIRLVGSTCHDRFCVPCAKERSRIIVHNVLDQLGDVPVRFLTLTLKGAGEPLADSVRRLTRAFTALRRRSLWRQKVTGGVAFIEVHWSRTSQRWHPHLHCLIQGEYIDKGEISRTWLDITKDSRIIDIRLVRSPEHLAKYVTKYASKPLNASFVNEAELLDEAITALRGKRLCVTFGTWQGVQLTTHPSDDEWEHLGDFEGIIYRAASGDATALAILRELASGETESLLATARRIRPPPPVPPPKWKQLDFLGNFKRSPF